MEQQVMLLPDNIYRAWGDVIPKGNPRCIIDIEERKKIIEQLLDYTLTGALIKDDKRGAQGIERRSIDAAHVKTLLDSLGKNNTSYDDMFIENGIDMSLVAKFYTERQRGLGGYMDGVVISV